MKIIFFLVAVLIMSGCASRSDMKNMSLLLHETRGRLEAIEKEQQLLDNTSGRSFTGMRTAMIELNQKTDAVTREQEKIQADFAKLRASSDDMMARLQKQLDDMQALNDKLQPISEDIEQLQREYNATQRAIAELQTNLGRELHDLRTQITSAGAAPATGSQPPATISPAPGDFVARIDNLNRQLLAYQNENAARIEDFKRNMSVLASGLHVLLDSEASAAPEQSAKVQRQLQAVETAFPDAAREQ